MGHQAVPDRVRAPQLVFHVAMQIRRRYALPAPVQALRFGQQQPGVGNVMAQASGILAEARPGRQQVAEQEVVGGLGGRIMAPVSPSGGGAWSTAPRGGLPAWLPGGTPRGHPAVLPGRSRAGTTAPGPPTIQPPVRRGPVRAAPRPPARSTLQPPPGSLPVQWQARVLLRDPDQRLSTGLQPGHPPARGSGSRGSEGAGPPRRCG